MDGASALPMPVGKGLPACNMDSVFVGAAQPCTLEDTLGINTYRNTQRLAAAEEKQIDS